MSTLLVDGRTVRSSADAFKRGLTSWPVPRVRNRFDAFGVVLGTHKAGGDMYIGGGVILLILVILLLIWLL
jgi:hypothetical protein